MSAASPRVAIVVPTFNRRRLVLEAVESVLAQTLSDFELIVVDDGSTDGTGDEIAQRYADEPRLRYVHKENGGTASARNRGLDEVRAPLTAFLDSDDLWAPEYLETQLAALEAHPEADLVLCDARLEGGWKREGATIRSRPSWRVPDSLDAMLNGAWALPSCMLLRTDVVKKLRFSTDYRHSEDTEFLFRFNAEGHTCIENPVVLAVWRKHAGGDQAAQKMDQKEGMLLEHLEMLEAYADRAKDTKRAHYQINRKRALYLSRNKRWREARPYLWRWWRYKPDSMRALRYLIRSLFA